jgi:tetratricopeptide (TPR) repeat protein
MRTTAKVACVLVGPLLAGCAAWSSRPPAKSTGYQTTAADPLRDTDLARAEHARAVGLMDKGDYDAAEAALKAALTADVMFGPAHNNLGKVYFRKGELYRAAQEFNYAMKLMPNQPEPANNLGMVFEARGRLMGFGTPGNGLDDAIEAYAKAAALEPDNVQILGNWARARALRVRRGERDADLAALLNKLVARETRPDWLAWEQRELIRLNEQPPAAPAEAAREPSPGG